MFRRNVGGLDRVLRLALGGILFLAGLLLLTSQVRPGVILAVVGALAVATGILRFCALYLPFGISTARPGRPLLNPVCDCAAWMKATPDNRSTGALPALPKEKESTEAMTAVVHRALQYRT
jgi:hypothetical protein